MHDPRRRREILDKLEKLWAKYPAVRLGQLMASLATAARSSDVFYTQDSVLEETIEQVLADGWPWKE